MTSLVALAERKLECIYDAIVKQTLASGYLMMDPTPVRLKSETRKGSTKEACVWTYRALDGPVFFEFAENKTGETPANTLQSYEGILQTDGASNFGGVPARENIVHLCCWAHGRRYFLHAPSRIDNNLAENSLRPIKLGAKNWLFVGHENAGPRMAKMYTLVENCRMLDLNPEEYLIDVLARVDDHPLSRIEELTPAGWRESKNS